MSANDNKPVKVKLLKPHQHGGMKYDAGVDIEVPVHDADWLKNLKIAEDTKVAIAITKTAEEK